MKKNKILLLIFMFILIPIYKITAYEKFNSGDLVKYNNIAFYVLFDSDENEDSVRLLKMTPLTHEQINKYTDNKAYAINENNKLNYKNSIADCRQDYCFYGNMAYYYGDNCYDYDTYGYRGIYSGCKYDYNSSNVKKVVDAWVNEYFENDDIIEEDGYKSRLLKYDEYSTLATIEYGYIKNAPKWLFSDSWTMTDWEGCTPNTYGSGCGVYAVQNNYISTQDPTGKSTVRPTLTLKKSAIKKVNISDNEYHDNKKREYKVGDIINYNEVSFYVIKNSDENDDTVTLLKKEPLTKYELNKYGEGYINNYIYRYNWKDVEPGKVIDNKKVAYLSTSNCYYNDQNGTYDYSGCNPNYDVSNVKHIVDNWANDTISDSDLKTDSYGYKARLVNNDDLNDLGFVSGLVATTGNTNYKLGDDTPSFILDTDTYNMLTMIHSYTYTYYGGRVGYGIAVVDENYNFVAREIPNIALGTVRPVIILSKKEIAKKITNVEEEEENVVVDIATEVENQKNDEDNLIVEVPNTLSKYKIIFGIIGGIIITISCFTFIYFKQRYFDK